MLSTNLLNSALTIPGHRQRLLLWLALPVAALALTASGGARAQSYVNVTIGGAFAPGVYGQIAIGNNPLPPIINAQPIIVGRPVYGAPVMYLYVAPEEYRDWGRYCSRYRACGHPVHFVQVDQRNRWWEHHNEHLRGEAYYRKPEHGHNDNRHGDKNDHHDKRQDDNRR
jgi:hypothetical protein